MLPDCSRDCSLAPEQLQDSVSEQVQDSITVATVDSYQVRSDSSMDPEAEQGLHHNCISFPLGARLWLSSACVLPAAF